MAAMTGKRWGIVVLTVLTAVIHIALYFGANETLFLLNGLGYLGLLAALYFVPQLSGMRSLIRWGLLAYTAVTVVLYFLFNWPDVWGPMGLADKAIELVLIGLLYLDKD